MLYSTFNTIDNDQRKENSQSKALGKIFAACRPVSSITARFVSGQCVCLLQGDPENQTHRVWGEATAGVRMFACSALYGSLPLRSFHAVRCQRSPGSVLSLTCRRSCTFIFSPNWEATATWSAFVYWGKMLMDVGLKYFLLISLVSWNLILKLTFNSNVRNISAQH